MDTVIPVMTIFLAERAFSELVNIYTRKEIKEIMITFAPFCSILIQNNTVTN